MRPAQFNYPGADYNGIAATQSWTTATGAQVILNGAYSLALGDAVDPTQRYAILPGIQRTIGVFSTGTLTGVVFYASGIDTDGRVVTASFAGASGGSSAATDSFATFTPEFAQVNYIYATSAATSAFTIGTGATGSTRWYTADQYPSPFNMTVAVITATGYSVNIQDTPNDPNTTSSPTVFTHATLSGVVANQESNYTFPVRFVRGVVTTGTGNASGTTAVTILIQQAGI